MKKCKLISAAILAALTLSACGPSDGFVSRGSYKDVDDDDGGKDDGGKDDGGIVIPEAELPEDEVFLVSQYANGAWGHSYSATFIDTKGYVYSFDSSMDSYFFGGYEDDIGLSEEFDMIRQCCEPSAQLDIEIIKKAYALGMQIDPDAELESEQVACDAGQHTLYFINPETDEWIEVSSYGDVDCTPTDKYAKEFEKFYDGQFKFNPARYYQLYVRGDIPIKSFNCGYSDMVDGGFFFKDTEDLYAFSALSGIRADCILDGLDEYEQEYFDYFVYVTNVSSGGYDLKASAIANDGDRYYFISDYESVYPEPDSVQPAVMDGFCFVAAWPEIWDESTVGPEWRTMDQASAEYGWTKPEGNPDLTVYDDGSVPIMEPDSTHAPAVVFTLDGYVLDTERSTNQAAYWYREDDPSYHYEAFYDMPYPDSDYFFYGVMPNDYYSFEEDEDPGRMVHGYDLHLAYRCNQDDTEDPGLWYLYFLYGPDASPYAFSVSFSEPIMMEMAGYPEELQDFITAIFGE